MSDGMNQTPGGNVYAATGLGQSSTPPAVQAGAASSGQAEPRSYTPPYVNNPAPAVAYAGEAAQAQPAKKHNTGYIVAIVILSVLLVLALGVAGCSVLTATSLGIFQENSSSTLSLSGESVAVIDIDSTIEYGSGANGPEGLATYLEQAENNAQIKAIVLHVNSGGGTSAAGEEMAKLVAACTKPVVVSSAATNASAAYEISSQADYIFVNNSTFIGSIGTAIQFVDMSGLYEKLGINYQNVVSSSNKDASYGTRPLTDEELAYYQTIVEQVTDNFIQTVASGRNMSEADVRALATGQVFTGADAIENGLADAIGTYEDALDYAAQLGGIQGDYSVVNLSQASSLDLTDLLRLFMDDETQLSEDQKSALIEELSSQDVVSWRSVAYHGAVAVSQES